MINSYQELQPIVGTGGLAAARSQNGSCIINAIHYRSATSLPRRSVQRTITGKKKAVYSGKCFKGSGLKLVKKMPQRAKALFH